MDTGAIDKGRQDKQIMQTQDTHILVLNRSFWPDIEATGQFLTELCERLVRKYKVTVIVGRSYYAEKDVFKPGRLYNRETFNGINILRVRHTRFWKGNLLGRIINWFTYGVLAFTAALKIKPKAIIACTDPPFLGIITMVLGRLKQVPFIYNCRDLYPDVAWEMGRLDKADLLGRIFDYLNKKAFSCACGVVCLGESMKNRIIGKGISREHIRVIPDWVDTSRIKPVSRSDNPLLEKFGLREKFVIMYSGNIGLSQDFRLILQSVAKINDWSSFYLVFVGEGALKESLKDETESLGLENVLFLSYQSPDMLSFSLSMADLHLIPLKKGMAGTIVPSKLYGIMAVAKPYLAITDKQSEPARLAGEFGCGLWVDPDDLEGIKQTIVWALSHPRELEKMGQIGRQLAETKFEKSVVIGEWFDVLNEKNI
jgi:glycosyltransferase involved in cell wall biosynthesis